MELKEVQTYKQKTYVYNKIFEKWAIINIFGFVSGFLIFILGMVSINSDITIIGLCLSLGFGCSIPLINEIASNTKNDLVVNVKGKKLYIEKEEIETTPRKLKYRPRKAEDIDEKYKQCAKLVKDKGYRINRAVQEVFNRSAKGNDYLHIKKHMKRKRGRPKGSKNKK